MRGGRKKIGNVMLTSSDETRERLSMYGESTIIL